MKNNPDSMLRRAAFALKLFNQPDSSLFRAQNDS